MRTMKSEHPKTPKQKYVLFKRILGVLILHTLTLYEYKHVFQYVFLDDSSLQ